MSEDDVLALEPLQYSVDTFVRRGMFTWVYGPRGSKKTSMAGPTPPGTVTPSPPARCSCSKPKASNNFSRASSRGTSITTTPTRPFRVLDEPMDLSSPEGAAALVRTVRGMEAVVGERVELIVLDPTALYMSVSENEGERQAT